MLAERPRSFEIGQERTCNTAVTYSKYKRITMIAFRDFSSAEHGRPEGIDRALVEANEWLQRTGINPLNIETLTKVTGGGLANISSSDIGLRVWYVVGRERTLAG